MNNEKNSKNENETDDIENENQEVEEEVVQEESIFLTESEANLQYLLMIGAIEKVESTEGLLQSAAVLCTLHVADSKSDLREHPFFYLQYVKDPGILRVLHGPDPEIIYNEDGQDKYKFMCNLMNSCFLKKFYNELLTTGIQFNYFGIDSRWMRAMCESLWENKTVKVLNLARNVFTTDACYHLGELIVKNRTISDYNLMGCQIGMEGMRRLIRGLEMNKKIRLLNLGHNDLKDEGMKIFASALGNPILEVLSLKYNSLKPTSGIAFAKNFKGQLSKLTFIDFSWNFLKNKGVDAILTVLRRVQTLAHVNLSWNAVEYSDETTDLVGRLMRICKKLEFIDISNNMLGDSLIMLSTYFPYVPTPHIKLGSNQITSEGATMIFENFVNERIKIKILEMDNTNITPRCLEIINDIKQIRSRRNTIVIYGSVIDNYTIAEPNKKELAFKRAQFLSEKKKKSFASFMLRMEIFVQGEAYMNENLFAGFMKKEKLGIDQDLSIAIAKPYTSKKKGLNLKAMVKLVLEMWPEATPFDDQPKIEEKEPEEEEIDKKGKKDKGGKGKKKK